MEARLLASLHLLGLELRKDSVLCADFIAGTSSMTAERVAHEMAIMHWLHSYTTYRSDLEKVVQLLMKDKGAFKGIWRQAAAITKTFIIATQKPDWWPWLEA